MARILIISSGSPCRNPRPVKEAQTLGQAGHEVTLLTVCESQELLRQEAVLTAGAPYRHEAVDRDPGQILRFWRRLRRRIAVTSTEWGLESLHALGYPGSLERRAREIEADLTIVHNEIPFWIGCRLMRAGRRVAADFEDWYSEDLLPETRRHRPLRKLRRLEQELLRHAVYTSTTSQALSTRLAGQYGAPAPLVLTNSFPLQDNPRSGSPGDPPAFFWFSQTIGPGRGLDEFFQAWRQTRHPSRVVLLGNLIPDYGRHLLALVPDSFRPRVSFLPLVQPNELPTVIARHDIGLALEPATPPNKDLTISNKILQYLNAGLAVIASDTAGQSEVLRQAPDAGLRVNPGRVDDLASRMDALLAEPARIRAMGAAARRAAESTYCWEREAPRLIHAVTTALARPPTAP
jgi:glycosyltransferase involved in cell wall biosynthesis